MKRPVLMLKVLVSLLFLAGLIALLDIGELSRQARDIDGFYLALSVVFSFLMVAASTWKWWYLMRLQGCPLPYLTLYRWYFIGYFYSNFLPSNVGGDVARAWLAGRKTGAPAAALAAVVAERVTGLLLLLLLAVCLPFLAPEFIRHPAVGFGMLVGLVGLIVLLALGWGGRAGLKSDALRRWREGLRVRLGADRPGKRQLWWEKAEVKVGRFGERIGVLAGLLRRRPGAAAAVLGLTVLFYAMMVVNVALAYRAFGVWPEWREVTAVLPVALLVAMIPVTLGNLGIAEGSYVFYFGLAGMGRELTLAMGLLLRVKIIILGLVGMLVQAGETVEPLPRSANADGDEPT
ncbi:MAG TPA: lysylphosphatidylglycerol synthase transmembrane domain-containing protein [Kiritimatiellia bacterium]|nr:lysylphosphatidylglycerol synthase transmembrane domain-containing protein [Kiritimatiellia bacterium]HMO98712.1 lysylphosphatidylglycerol synthase transmembrane domain-containing protein [Kiritimatiellia bacterium]HMP97852.1 lysylphosphatidylglycerol synthase transmembrane domain-containing protein [Kiritimatiellia bacterium]